MSDFERSTALIIQLEPLRDEVLAVVCVLPCGDVASVRYTYDKSKFSIKTYNT